MNIKLIHSVSKKFAKSDKNNKFMNFAHLFALISVMLGSMSLIIALSVLDGFETVIKAGIMKFRSHLTVTSFSSEYLPNRIKTIAKINSYKGVTAVEPVIENEGLIRSKHYTEGILIKGITQNYVNNHIKINIISGNLDFSAGNKNEIIIGKRLANRLGVAIGDELVVYAMKNLSSGNFQFPEIEKFTVIAIYETGFAKYDDVYAYIQFAKAAELFDLPDNTASSYEVTLADYTKANKASFELFNLLGYPFYCFSVFELHRDIFAWIDLQKAPIPIVLALISLVAVLNIITILLIGVIEKTHSTGILKALGMSGRDIMLVFIYKGVIIGFIGTLLGCALGYIFGTLQNTYGLISLKADIYYLDKLPIDMKLWHFEIVIFLTVLLSFFASILPSWLTVRVKPIIALKYK